MFYHHNGVELVVQVESQFSDLWSLRELWSDACITFSGPELALLRDALNRLDLLGVVQLRPALACLALTPPAVRWPGRARP